MAETSVSEDIVIIPCNLCGSESTKVVYHQRGDFNMSSTQGQMTTDKFGVYGQILKCRKCKLVYQPPYEPTAHIFQAYSEMKDEDYLLEHEARSINSYLSLQIIKKYKEKGALLDIGCSIGYFLNAARLNFSVQGLEASTWAVQVGRDILKLDIKQGSLTDHPFQEESFDVITLIDVIEHFTDPITELRRIHKLLKPNGIIYLVTPNFGSFSSCLMGRYWWGLRPAHLYYFTRDSIRKMLKETGFEIQEIKSYGRLFTYGYWLSRLKNYPKILYGAVGFFIRIFGVETKLAYINTFDSMELVAKKASSSSEARSKKQ